MMRSIVFGKNMLLKTSWSLSLLRERAGAAQPKFAYLLFIMRPLLIYIYRHADARDSYCNMYLFWVHVRKTVFD